MYFYKTCTPLLLLIKFYIDSIIAIFGNIISPHKKTRHRVGTRKWRTLFDQTPIWSKISSYRSILLNIFKSIYRSINIQLCENWKCCCWLFWFFEIFFLLFFEPPRRSQTLKIKPKRYKSVQTPRVTLFHKKTCLATNVLNIGPLGTLKTALKT